MPQVRNCPFSGAEDRTCEQSDCRLWVTYIKHGGESQGECVFKILVLMGLPNFGANVEEDVD